EADTDAPIVSAKESDKGWTINGPRVVSTRAPAPAIVNVSPASIVKRGVAPGLVAYPGPTPGTDPIPVAVAVWSPIHGNGARIPHVAVVRLFVPGSVIVEVVVAGNVTRNVFRGDGIVFAQIALRGPAIEPVRRCCLSGLH